MAWQIERLVGQITFLPAYFQYRLRRAVTFRAKTLLSSGVIEDPLRLREPSHEPDDAWRSSAPQHRGETERCGLTTFPESRIAFRSHQALAGGAQQLVLARATPWNALISRLTLVGMGLYSRYAGSNGLSRS